MLSRSSVETQKLELLSSVTELKRQLVALSRENAELRTLQPHRPPVAPRTFYPSQSQVSLKVSVSMVTCGHVVKKLVCSSLSMALFISCDLKRRHSTLSQLLRDASPGPGTGSPLHRNTASPGLEHAESCREIRELTRDIPPPRVSTISTSAAFISFSLEHFII